MCLVGLEFGLLEAMQHFDGMRALLQRHLWDVFEGHAACGLRGTMQEIVSLLAYLQIIMFITVCVQWRLHKHLRPREMREEMLCAMRALQGKMFELVHALKMQQTVFLDLLC